MKLGCSVPTLPPAQPKLRRANSDFGERGRSPQPWHWDPWRSHHREQRRVGNARLAWSHQPGAGSARQPGGAASTRDRQLWEGAGGAPRASLTPGRMQGEGEALLSAACWGTGTNWVLQGRVDWEISCSPGTGRGYLCLIPGGGGCVCVCVSQMRFLCTMAHGGPQQGWHPPIFPIFISYDANAAGNTSGGGSHHICTGPLCCAQQHTPILQKGKLRHGGGQRQH